MSVVPDFSGLVLEGLCLGQDQKSGTWEDTPYSYRQVHVLAGTEVYHVRVQDECREVFGPGELVSLVVLVSKSGRLSTTGSAPDRASRAA